MKNHLLTVALVAGLGSFIAWPAAAQTGTPQGRPGATWKKSGQPDGAGLSADERQRLSAAREKAKSDPTVRSLEQARQAIDEQLQSAMNAAMVAADPSLAPTLEKVKQSRDRAQRIRRGVDALTPGQREQLKQARQAAMQDPAVQAAREKMKAADSPEARRAAGREMREAVKAAVTKENPELAPVMERLGPDFGEGKGPKGPKGPQS